MDFTNPNNDEDFDEDSNDVSGSDMAAEAYLNNGEDSKDAEDEEDDDSSDDSDQDDQNEAALIADINRLQEEVCFAL